MNYDIILKSASIRIFWDAGRKMRGSMCMERHREIEKSIIKRYRSDIWSKFIKAVNEFHLIEENDKIAVCISGGKDSMLLAKCLEELKRHGKIHFELVYLVMDPGYNAVNLKKIKDNLQTLHIQAELFSSDIFAVTQTASKRPNDNPCYLCARMRRGFLYSKAQALGCNKIALGHHFNDVIETILMNMLFNGQYSSMMPKLHSDHFAGMELIRPLYYVRENYIKAWANYNQLEFIDCACQVTKKGIGKRAVMKQLVNELCEIYKDADANILRSTFNVNLNTLIAYQQDGKTVSFLDQYNQE